MRTLIRVSVLLSVLLITGRVLYAQLACYSAGGVGGIGAIQADGKRHIKVNMPAVGTGTGQVNQATRDAIGSAVGAWSGLAATTGIVFDPVASGGQITISRNSGGVSGAGALCSAKSGTNVYIDDYINGLGSNPSGEIAGRTHAFIIEYLIKHEMGHILNLAEYNGGNSIMNGGDPTVSPSPTTCPGLVANAWPSNDGIIEDADVTKAAECANRTEEVESPDEGFFESEPVETCWDVYLVHVTYTFNGSYWVLTSYWSEFVYTDCTSDPYPQG